jgi:hypothetical protein
MADETYYAWSPIKVGGKFNTETQQVDDVKVINPGDTVTAGDLEIEEEEFQSEYVNSGVVRPIEYPEDIPPGKSAMQHLRDQAMEAGVAYETTGGTYLLDDAQQMAVAAAAQKELEDAEEVEDEETPDNAEQLAHMPILAENGGGAADAPATTPAATQQTTTTSS